eukprot:TRINITY_DN5028_c0_g1_i2.p1 TRINITY_DN5028_c0_g1~~TRINITY_DN5028_c0_g1_i2.p1  ORF type:complete len:250 (+),score=45.87 TRINITY_DN5028_c0_g1_i2:384-1133(+)
MDHPNVLQLGAADAKTALEAASIVSRDVDGIDLNMGCPIHFSVQGGMGSALLKKPEIAVDILSTLKRNLPNPITCKVRLLETIPQTIDMLKMLEATGVSAMTVHTRHVKDRPRDPAKWDYMTHIVQGSLNVPLVINGDVFKREDIERARKETGASSIMIARGAMWDPSIFSETHEDVEVCITKYLNKCMEMGNNFKNSKYVVMQMCETLSKKAPRWIATQSSKNMAELCDIWDVNYVQTDTVVATNDDE